MPDTNPAGPPPPLPLSLAVVPDIGALDAEAWNACAAGQGPLLRHAALRAAEESGLAGPANGWQATHLTARDPNGRLVGAVPLYLRHNSDHDHWADQNWAAGYQAAGGRYYPKLLTTVPFAPVTGRRLLLHPDAPPGTAQVLVRGMETLARRYGLSSIHAAFPDNDDRARFEAAGWLTRQTIQYEWRNTGYRDFDEFLGCLSSRRRITLRRERRAVRDSGVTVRDVPGDRVKETDVALFLDLLNDLHRRRATPQPLTADYLLRLCAGLGDLATLTFADREGVTVGALLSVTGDGRMSLRNWGCRREARFLHFEICYHRTVEQAIQRGLSAIEGGYGGPHKLARGFLPKLVHACHWFLHPNLRAAVAADIAQQRPDIEAVLLSQQARAPFRHQPLRHEIAAAVTGQAMSQPP
ncbi:GNAT family N-acetyltransferase [Azospirillum griseum]|uniref:GNAT family N-acetyltransferase n=1 Tax=Azospirillum griseum TaxID=2496639 RepID=A0A431VBZ7_9PROT|nr:GNAT family N-acetyltransferase [Azospirillum griseum]RTR16282.1 GNAT family N-acetyltransferase [Azospirillum griseum]